MEKEETLTKKENEDTLNPIVTGMAQCTLVQKNGEAASQMIQALQGKRYDTNGSELSFKGRNLEKISKYKINPDFEKNNIKQQSGFSAELIKEARDNKKAIISGDGNRIRTTDGLGDTNNQQYDHKIVDGKGNVIDHTGSQMKFYGIDAKGHYKVVDSIVKDNLWDKYDGLIDVPKEQYQGALNYADEQAGKLREQAAILREKGRFERANEMESRANAYEKSKKRLRQSDVATNEAINARIDPKKFVAKEVINDTNKAGIEAAKGALLIGGSISVAQNLYSVFVNEKPIDEAITDVVKTTAKSGAMSYGVGASGTMIKAVMHSSKKEIIRKVGNTNAPAMIVTATVQIANSIKRYGYGEIDETQLLQELGEKGTGMVAAGYASAVGATVGGTMGSVVPVIGTAAGAVIGGFIGSMVGYTSSSILYKGTLEVLEEAKISEERRRVIEKLSQEAIREQILYRSKLRDYATTQYHLRESTYANLFSVMEKSIMENDMNKYISCMDSFGEAFGIKLKLNSFEEIDEFMSDQSTTFIL